MATTDGSAAPRGPQSGPIVVYGASGYTGKLIAAELSRRGAEITLAGRNREKLEEVAAGLAGSPAVAAVALDDAAALRVARRRGCRGDRLRRALHPAR